MHLLGNPRSQDADLAYVQRIPSLPAERKPPRRRTRVPEVPSQRTTADTP